MCSILIISHRISVDLQKISTIPNFIEKELFHEMVKSIFQLSMGNISVKRRKIKGLNSLLQNCVDCDLRFCSRSREFLRIDIRLTPLVGYISVYFLRPAFTVERNSSQHFRKMFSQTS